MHIGQFPIEILFQDDFKFCKDDNYKYLSHVKPHAILLGEVCGGFLWGFVLGNNFVLVLFKTGSHCSGFGWPETHSVE